MKESNEKTLCDMWLLMNGAYDDYAKSKGLTYTSMFILYILSYQEECTQKELCQKNFLPKQTIHSAVTSLYKDGLVEMKELPQDRRNKNVRLTPKGQTYRDTVVPHITNAEAQAFCDMTDEE